MLRILKYKELGIFSLQHAYIDAVSAFIVLYTYKFSGMNKTELFYLIVFYNFMAFSTQWFIGIIADRYYVYKILVLVSMIFPILALSIFKTQLFIAVGIVGLANALLHVGAGSSVLAMYRYKAFYPGLFVSMGALGLLIGNLMVRYSFYPLVLAIIGLIFFLLTWIFIFPKNIKYTIKDSIKVEKGVLIISLLLSVILIRGLVGTALFFPWKNVAVYGALLVIATFLGKVLGGYIADKIGFTKVGVLSLLLSALFIALGFTIPFFGIVGIFFFQMTMSITLVLIAGILPNRLGLSFGLTTLAIFCSIIPIFLQLNIFISKLNIIFLIVLSSVLLYTAISLYKSNAVKIKFDRI